MTFTLRDLKPDSSIGQMGLHQLLLMPPNVEDCFAAAVAASTLAVGAGFNLDAAGNCHSWGGASSVHLNVGAVGDLSTNDVFEIEIIGFDERQEPASERLRLVGGATPAVTDQVRSNFCYSYITSAIVTEKSGVSTATFALGVGNSVGGPSTAPFIRVPHPYPGMPYQNLGLVQNGTDPGAAQAITIQGMSGTSIDGLPGRYLELNYTGTPNTVLIYGLYHSVARSALLI